MENSGQLTRRKQFVNNKQMKELSKVSKEAVSAQDPSYQSTRSKLSMNNQKKSSNNLRKVKNSKDLNVNRLSKVNQLGSGFMETLKNKTRQSDINIETNKLTKNDS